MIPQKNQFKIGSDGLRLTVCTLKTKGNKGQFEMTENEMNSVRRIDGKDVKPKRDQVFLGIRYDNQQFVRKYSTKRIIDSKSVFDVGKC